MARNALVFIEMQIHPRRPDIPGRLGAGTARIIYVGKPHVVAAEHFGFRRRTGATGRAQRKIGFGDVAGFGVDVVVEGRPRNDAGVPEDQAIAANANFTG
jgi:hypothetical protein